MTFRQSWRLEVRGGHRPLIRRQDVVSPVKPWLAIILVVVVIVAAIAGWGARPGPVFSLSGVNDERYCFYDTTQGNYSFWSVYFNITNRGASASAAAAISVDGTGVLYQYFFVRSSASVAVHKLVTDPAIPTDPTCTQHNVTVAIRGYVF